MSRFYELMTFNQLTLKVPPKRTPFVGSKADDEREVGGVMLCWCPPGRFRMGSPPREPERRPDETQVGVALSKGFWMGRTAEARASYDMALTLARQEPERRFLERRLAELG
jgi:formylglycine-generating enzyme required for sulfatase activity